MRSVIIDFSYLYFEIYIFQREQGDETSLAEVEKEMPKRVKKRRQVCTLFSILLYCRVNKLSLI